MKNIAANNINKLPLPGFLLLAGLSGKANAALRSWSKSGCDPANAYYSIGGTVAASATATTVRL